MHGPGILRSKPIRKRSNPWKTRVTAKEGNATWKNEYSRGNTRKKAIPTPTGSNDLLNEHLE